MKFKAIVGLIMVAAVTGAMGADETSKYVPMCFEVQHTHPQKKNSFLLFSGPTTLKKANGAPETLITTGYTRRLSDELSLGALIHATEVRFLGGSVGFEFHF